ncbi:M23 family metallopeptidase [Caballeronia sp. LZ025]|uniref:M23 family metallopeptidase n=1 Tax=Caballeronia TaxID=1827195 RepID=UPI001FD269B1|nr:MULTISPECIES: M23 family metallopeptidase [Caballeronia]MDR5734149.1 M23 family metallopeptidase [Caballeronia sp. LZ025]
MMDLIDDLELAHGIYPVAHDRRWHCGVHLAPNMHGDEANVYAIADGEVVAYRVCQNPIDTNESNAGFVLLRHETETGDGRTITFYSLYMHLLSLAQYQSLGHDASKLPAFLRMPSGQVATGQVAPALAGGGKRVMRKDVLGFLGQYQGLKYLHFEIFMRRTTSMRISATPSWAIPHRLRRRVRIAGGILLPHSGRPEFQSPAAGDGQPQ